MLDAPLSPADALAQQARADLARLSYPDRNWIEPHFVDGQRLHAVAIVGAGQCGLTVAHGLRREGVRDIVLLDQRDPGQEGVWLDFARMDELRTPKQLCGPEFGQPSLSVQSWFEAVYGADAWQRLERLPRAAWAAYWRWYRATLGLEVTSNTAVAAIAPRGDLAELTLRRDGIASTLLARTVVLATGYDGGGTWTVPEVVANALPPDRYHHSNGPIDFAALAGQRIGILGHGASAFDAAVAALRAGAARVDLCFRRPRLPTANPHRFVETGGFMAHFAALPDAARWEVIRQFRAKDQPPAEGGYRAALALPGFHLHAGCPWTEVSLHGEAIHVQTPRGPFEFDHLICATGLRPGLDRRPELAEIAPRAVLWGERFAPPPGEDHPGLARYPYLGPNYEFLPRDPGDAWLRRVFAFNAASVLSHGPHSTSISGLRQSVPRVVAGITRLLFVEQAGALLDGLRAYDAPDLVP